MIITSNIIEATLRRANERVVNVAEDLSATDLVLVHLVAEIDRLKAELRGKTTPIFTDDALRALRDYPSAAQQQTAGESPHGN